MSPFVTLAVVNNVCMHRRKKTPLMRMLIHDVLILYLFLLANLPTCQYLANNKMSVLLYCMTTREMG